MEVPKDPLAQVSLSFFLPSFLSLYLSLSLSVLRDWWSSRALYCWVI